MAYPATRILRHADIVELIDLDQVIAAVEEGMAMHAQGQVIAPDLLHADGRGGEFHIKIGGLLGSRPVFGLKANGGFFGNRESHQLPNILGVIYLADADTGAPLALVDSIEISRQRTGAASAVAAKYLAREDASRIGIIGAGTQARVQFDAISRVRPLRAAKVWARDASKASAFAAELARDFKIEAQAVDSPAGVAQDADIIVTTTPSNSWLLPDAAVQAGTFIAAVGADSPGKQEIEPSLMRRARIVADVATQVIRVGESQHVIADGSLRPEDLHAQIGEVITGARPGREEDETVFVYDSTGTALQDVAAALSVLQAAEARDLGLAVTFGA